MKLLKVLPVSLLLLLPLGTKAALGIGMSNSWQQVTMGRQACLRRAEASLREAGFTENFEIAGNYIAYGDQGEYTAAIECITDKGVVTFVVAGPRGDQCTVYRKELVSNF